MLELDFWDPASPGTATELRRARIAIEDLRLGALVYFEVGLDVRTFVLAHSRLAPVQLATYGHAATTGIPTIDYFVSHEVFEPDPLRSRPAQAQYSEHLVRLPGLPYFEASMTTGY